MPITERELRNRFGGNSDRLSFQSAGAVRKRRPIYTGAPVTEAPPPARVNAWRLLAQAVEAFGDLTEDGDVYNALADVLKRRPAETR